MKLHNILAERISHSHHCGNRKTSINYLCFFTIVIPIGIEQKFLHIQFKITVSTRNPFIDPPLHIIGVEGHCDTAISWSMIFVNLRRFGKSLIE